MKYIKLFETAAQRNAAVLNTPYLVYTKETGVLEVMDVQPIEKATNPEFMALCYAKGWAANEDYMTKEECAAVTDAMFASLTKAQLRPVKSLEELKYFTGLTVLPDYGMFDENSQIEVVHFPPQMTSYATTSTNGVFSNCPYLRKVVFPDNLSSINVRCTTFNRCFQLKHIDLSNTKITNLCNKFSYNSDLISISLPATITSATSNDIIFSSANAGYSWVRLFRTSPMDHHVQNRCNSNTRFYVPDESVNDYKQSSIYSVYASKIFPMSQWQEDLDNGIITFV